MNAGIKPVMSARNVIIVPGQPAVIIVTVGNTPTGFYNQEMIIMHAISFREEGGQEPEKQSGGQDNIQGMLPVILFDSVHGTKLAFLPEFRRIA